MAQSKWEADKMLDVYIYDYLMKRNLQATAKAFLSEGNVATDPVAIDAPGGFLFEWWSVFWDIFIARTNPKHSDVAAAFIETQQMKAREQQQQQQMQQLQLMQQRQVQLQQQQQQQQQQQHQHQQQPRDPNHPVTAAAVAAFNGAMNSMNSDPVLGSSAATVLAAKLIEERMKNPNSLPSDPSPQLLDGRMALLKSAASNRPGQLVQGNTVNMSTLQQIQARSQQPRSLSVDPASIYGQGIMQAKPGLSGVGLNQGVSGLPLKGWPLTGIDQLRPNLGMQKPFVSSQNQVQLMSPRQQFMAQAQAQVQSNLGGMTSSADMDPQRFRALPGAAFSGKDGQANGTDGSIGSPVQSSSSKMQQSSNQQQQEMQQHTQQLQQNNRKRKPASSGAANSTGTGNHAGPSPPSTPSTHTPGDAAGVPMPSSLQQQQQQQQQMGVMQKTSSMMYGSDAIAGFASSSNQMDILDHCGDIGFFDDNVESFLSNDDADAREIFAALKRSPADSESLKGFAFTEAECNRTSSSKVVCCHFSSDGKILASAGHDKKVMLWNMENLQTEFKNEEHSNFITDIRFRPNSTQLATSSSDGTVRLWNAADRGGCLQTFVGHSSPVMSLDFNPKRPDLLSSCDGNGEIRFWHIGQNQPFRVTRGGMGKVRFQPRIGRLLAAAAENIVNIIDIEPDIPTRSLKGHNNVHSVCWDENGDFLASVSQDTVKVWSMSSMECVHEISSNGNKFHSCVFHPRYPKVLIIGGYQSLELWNVADNQRMTVQAHEGLISSLAQSPVTGLVASASHDSFVKIWK